MDDPKTLDDLALMARVKDGELRLLGELFDRHHQALFRFFVRLTGNRTLAEDAVQDTFHRILRYRHSFRGDGSFKAWLYQLGRNVVYDLTRGYQAPLEADEDRREAPEPGPAERLEGEDRQAQVRAALGRLPPQHREVLVLSRYQELPYQDIARVLDCTVGAVKLRVHRAVRALREELMEVATDA